MPSPLEEITRSALNEVALRRQTNLGARNAVLEGSASPTRNRISNLDPRTPFVMTCDKWLEDQPNKYLIWAFNPREVSFDISQRGEKQETRKGFVMHYWKNPGGDTFFKPFTMTLEMQSGNIMPLRWPSLGSDIPNVPEGLINFYQFIELVDEVKRFESTALALPGKKTNFTYLIYNSRIFPRITFKGFFNPSSVLRFNENADQPNMITGWTVNFEVTQSVPSLTRTGAAALKQAWKNEIRGTNAPGVPPEGSSTNFDDLHPSTDFGEIGEP